MVGAVRGGPHREAASGRCAARAPRMLRLHYYSDNPALAVAEDEETVYSIDLIKEFEAVDRAWKAFLADWLLKGPLVYVTHACCVDSVFVLFIHRNAVV